jgi:hypothetical protein
MKSNEIFIIGGALLAAILLFKGQASPSTSGSIPFISPFLSMLGKAETKAIQTLGSNIETLQSVKESNLGIAQSILDQERSLTDVKISQQQTELDKTQGYIGSQQRIAFPSSRTEQLRNAYGVIIAQENIAKANEMVIRQQGEIDRLNEEYQTRFGSLSRYG